MLRVVDLEPFERMMAEGLNLHSPSMSLSNSTADSSTAEIVAALRRGEASAAESLCREQLESDPASVEHLLLLGHALMLDRRYGEAETALRNALDAAPESPRVLEALGSALAQQRQFDEAIGVFEKAVKLDPEAVNAHRKLGQALAAVGRGIEADEAFEKYFEKDPDAAAVLRIGGPHQCQEHQAHMGKEPHQNGGTLSQHQCPFDVHGSWIHLQKVQCSHVG